MSVVYTINRKILLICVELTINKTSSDYKRYIINKGSMSDTRQLLLELEIVNQCHLDISY